MPTTRKSARVRSELALYGGPKTISAPDPDALRWPRTGEEEIAAATELIRRGELSFSKYSDLLARDFAHYLGAKYVLPTNNGTSAGHSCFFASGIQPGEEVICPSFTFWASIVEVLHLGGVPVFGEIDEDTLNLDPADVERRLTPRTKAILVVHTLGLPADMGAIMRIAHRHRLKVIEDCSHAHGATYRGRKVGTFGDVAFFSLQTSKLVTGGEGGLFVTNRRSYYERAALLGHYERIGSLRPSLAKYRHTCLGFKYRIHPLAAAIAYHQLKKLPSVNTLVRRNVGYFLQGLRRLKFWHVPEEPRHTQRVYYENWVRWRPEAAPGLRKELFIAALRAEGCVVQDARYELLSEQPVFQKKELYAPGGFFPALYHVRKKPIYRPNEFPVSARVRRELIHLPTFPGADRAFIDQYLKAFRKVEDGAEELIARGMPQR